MGLKYVKEEITKVPIEELHCVVGAYIDGFNAALDNKQYGYTYVHSLDNILKDSIATPYFDNYKISD